ncbi:nuclear pore complex protein [Thraustotheca clavata]|uniref:Nuclear pore complex protein n=1 Tax=Thraustotheca clavata TaxID=74557 RepID=A0A1V9ZHD4_9STRA|nr:nuclear pore complex protein [Thraustotheca clavata]
MAFRGFGTGTSTGGGFGFGSTAQPSSGFGSSTASTGFGGFGAAGNTSGAAASPFGAAASPFGGGANSSPAFGAPSGFGTSTTSAFGATTPATTSAFGNTSTGTAVGFGGFGTSTSTTPAFGASTTPAASPFGPTPTANAASPFGGGGGMFGAANTAKPAFGSTGFGATTSTFGSSTPSAFGSAPATNAFGATTPATGFGTTTGFGASATPAAGFGTSTGFGAAAQATNAFGAAASPSPFGAAPATTSAFGAQPTSAFGGGGYGATPNAAAQCGTGNPPYQATSEQETEKNKPATTIHYQSISKMPQYQHKSVEELRWEDYLKRTDPAAAQQQSSLVPPEGGTTTTGFGGFGATNTSGFGAKPPLSGGGAFGTGTTSAFGGSSTPAFGAPATSGFGAQPAATSGFGTTGAFGAPPSTTSAFGSGGSMFGGGTTTPAFGAPTATTTPSFGGFGATTQPATTGGFGAATTTPGFGTPTATTNAFGTPATGSPGFGGFGANTTTPATTNAFGAGANSAFSFNKSPTTPTTNAFVSTTGSGFNFGANPAPAATGGMFGSTTTPTTSAFGTGGFGSSAKTNTGFNFGGSTTTPSFGATSPAANAFSTTPAAPSSGFNFGGAGTTTNNTGFGSSMFKTTTTPSFSLGGATTSSTPFTLGGNTSGTGSSLFSFNNTATPGFGQPAATPAPATLVAGHDANPYGAGSFGAGLVEQQIKTTLTLPVPNNMPRKSSNGADSVDFQRPLSLVRPVATVPTSLHVPKSDVVVATPARRLLEESSSQTAPSSLDFSFSTTKFKSIATKQLSIDTPVKLRPIPLPAAPHVIPPEESTAKTALTVTLPSKTSLQVQIDSLATGADLKEHIADKAGLTGGFKINLNGSAVSDNQKVVELVNGTLEVVQEKTAPFVSFDAFYASESCPQNDFASPALNPLAPVLTKEGYYTLPDYSSLCTMTTAELQNVDNFAVGCKGMGCVQWYGVTDVTNLNLDELVLFSTREVVVYPGEDNKHELGSGLNKPALVELLQVYPPTQPTKRAQYIERVKTRTETMDATFIDYCPDAGVWKFRVEHFSRYGLEEEEDENEDMESAPKSLEQMATSLQLNPHRLHELASAYMPSEVVPVAPIKEQTLSTSQLVISEPAPTAKPSQKTLRLFPVATPSVSPTLALWNSFMKSQDKGIFLGRSYRASFGPNGELVTIHPKQLASIRTISAATGASSSLIAAHQAISVQDSTTKAVTLPADISTVLDGFCDALSGHMKLVMTLVQALYGQESKDSPYLPPISNDAPNLNDLSSWDRRRAYISQWLQKAVRRNTPNTGNTGVLKLLCQHRIVEAAQLALEMGNFRLATLIAQAVTYRDSEVRSHLLLQLETWASQNSLSFMEKELTWIYSLLAGSVEVVTHNQPQLEWLQMFAIVFWYSDGQTSLQAAVKKYLDSVSKTKPPLYQMKSDPLMELLHIAVGSKPTLVALLNVLEPDVAWHLHSMLTHLPGQSLRLTPKQASMVTRNYISMLIENHKIQDAIYVALNIVDAREREATVRQLLQHAAPNTALMQSLQPLVPSAWYHEAMATLCMNSESYETAVNHWLHANNFDQAHRALLLHVAIPSLFSGNVESLHKTLVQLEPHYTLIPLWARYGAVVLSYLRLRESPHIATLHVVLDVCAKLKQWQRQPLAHLGQSSTLLERACLSNMLTCMTQTAVAMEQSLGGNAAWLDRLQGYIQADCFGETFRATSLMHVCSAMAE